MVSALGLIVSHLESYLEGGFLNGAQSKQLKALLLLQLRRMRPHALALVNVVAPPDWVVWSPLGLKANHPTAPAPTTAAEKTEAVAHGAPLPTAAAGADNVAAAAALAHSHATDQTYDNYFHAVRTTKKQTTHLQICVRAALALLTDLRCCSS
jgi:hypothetical protein